MAKKEKLTFSNTRRNLSELIPLEWNPRTLSEKQAKDLRRSLEKFDLAEVPVINLDNKIIAGHQRTRILYQLHGAIEIDVRIPSRQMTEEEVKEYNIRSNKNSGDWDFDLLSSHFDQNDLIDWGFLAGDVFLTLPEEKELKEPKESKKEEIHVCPECGHEFGGE